MSNLSCFTELSLKMESSDRIEDNTTRGDSAYISIDQSSLDEMKYIFSIIVVEDEVSTICNISKDDIIRLRNLLNMVFPPNL